MDKQYTLSDEPTIIYAQVRDQFNVGLRDVNINFYEDGSDLGADFDPLNGQAITDKDGNVSIKYLPSGTYNGDVIIQVRADKSSAFTGSEYCWNSILNDSKVNFYAAFGAGAMWQKKISGGFVNTKQINDPFKVWIEDPRGSDEPSDAPAGFRVPPTFINAISLFGTPGGHWTGLQNLADEWEYRFCWPQWDYFPVRTDGPLSTDSNINNGCFWDCITWLPADENDEPNKAKSCAGSVRIPRVNYIRQVLEFSQLGVPFGYYLLPQEDRVEDTDDLLIRDAQPGKAARPLYLPQYNDFWQYHENIPTGTPLFSLQFGSPPAHEFFQIKESVNDLQMSQLNLSKHSYWVDGQHTLDLKTNVRLDQFIFVQDAIPTFWSEKNPRETYIWIRMRPYAVSLNGDTLKFYVREVYTIDDRHYDTGYYNLLDLYGPPAEFEDSLNPAAGCKLNRPICTQYFDAGGGALGLEFLYIPPKIFHHNSLVFVHIEIYDTAAEPNYIYTDYWFKVIPDYKSPYLENEDPGREEDQVALDTKLYFEVKDDGEGVDIDTLEVFINSRIVFNAMQPSNSNAVIEKVNLNHYKVTIDLPYDLQYGKEYSVGVRVKDISENKNMLRDSYRFYTRHSEIPWFTDFDPKICKKGMPRFTDVSFLALGAGDGVDVETLRLQVHGKDVTKNSKITPVIYRVS
jgi:hypothetical protein